jgi:lipoprotein-anchoring transpeptidase ErfK/SrfK
MSPVRRSIIAAIALLVFAVGAIASTSAREIVNFGGYSPGTIVVKTNERRLYFVMPGGKAVRYVVGVGRDGKKWYGSAYIASKHRNPDWSPPAEVKRDNPRLPDVIKGGTPQNPMGVAALVLSGDGQYAIHGTNRPESVGRFVSYGCIRMHNRDIADLYDRVSFGTPVIVER